MKIDFRIVVIKNFVRLNPFFTLYFQDSQSAKYEFRALDTCSITYIISIEI
jgi:hypothetical protein